MTLLEYLKSEKETVPAFARRTGIAETTIRKITYGQRQPSLALAVVISEATRGWVLPADMVLDHEDAA